MQNSIKNRLNKLEEQQPKEKEDVYIPLTPEAQAFLEDYWNACEDEDTFVKAVAEALAMYSKDGENVIDLEIAKHAAQNLRERGIHI
jgi:hypothetical protein